MSGCELKRAVGSFSAKCSSSKKDEIRNAEYGGK